MFSLTDLTQQLTGAFQHGIPIDVQGGQWLARIHTIGQQGNEIAAVIKLSDKAENSLLLTYFFSLISVEKNVEAFCEFAKNRLEQGIGFKSL